MGDISAAVLGGASASPAFHRPPEFALGGPRGEDAGLHSSHNNQRSHILSPQWVPGTVLSPGRE